MSKQLALVFPGQGSQSVGMLADLATHHSEVLATFAAASEALGYDLWKLVQEGPEQELMATMRTQPAMLTAGIAVWRVWQARGGVLPDLMAGHSLGEYSALVAAGALDFQEAVALVAERGRLMQEAVPNGVGAIAAVLGLGDDKVVAICTEAAQGEVISAVNFNAPEQVVVAGHAGAVDRALKLAKAVGAKRGVLLPMSVPAHSALMAPAVERFEKRLAEVALFAPLVPIIHNVDLSSRRDPEALRTVLVEQLHNPVRWADTVRLMGQRGIAQIVECGPGKVLSSLSRRVESRLAVLPVFDHETLSRALHQTNGKERIPDRGRGLRGALQRAGG